MLSQRRPLISLQVQTLIWLSTFVLNPVFHFEILQFYCLAGNLKPNTNLLCCQSLRSHEGNCSSSPFILSTDLNPTKVKTFFPCLVLAVSNVLIKKQCYNLHGLKWETISHKSLRAPGSISLKHYWKNEKSWYHWSTNLSEFQQKKENKQVLQTEIF